MTGYDKSSDYGGPPVWRWTVPAILAAFVAVNMVLAWIYL